ncbi:hypothetical protein ACO0LL_21295 [Undibacterium sp. TC4M20W]|uniref:hypothetical protein n=1 Tax=Undibacterium sp. TC4M20W TaxID=3413052 RepID=UPI003BF3FDBD
MQAGQDEYIASLLTAQEYAKRHGQVAWLSSKQISIVKLAPIKGTYELVPYQLSDCTRVTYKRDWHLLKLVSGILLVSLILFIFYMLGNYGVASNTTVHVGLLALALGYGVRWTWGSRRHSLLFEMKDGSKLRWKSGVGEFAVKRISVDKVRDFAYARGLLKGAA